jgi:hypothetical protein
MILQGNDIDITAQGQNNALDFYWSVNGSGSWNPETIAGQGIIYSAPSMDLNGNEVNITAAGPDGSLLYDWKVIVIGSGGWTLDTAAPAGSVG